MATVPYRGRVAGDCLRHADDPVAGMASIIPFHSLRTIWALSTHAFRPHMWPEDPMPVRRPAPPLTGCRPVGARISGRNHGLRPSGLTATTGLTFGNGLGPGVGLRRTAVGRRDRRRQELPPYVRYVIRRSEAGYAEVAELGEAACEIVPDRLREYRGQDHLALR